MLSAALKLTGRPSGPCLQPWRFNQSRLVESTSSDVTDTESRLDTVDQLFCAEPAGLCFHEPCFVSVCTPCARRPKATQSNIIAAAIVVMPKKTPPMGGSNWPSAVVSGIWLAPLHKVTTTEARTPATAPVYRKRRGHVPDSLHRVCVANNQPLPTLRSPDNQ